MSITYAITACDEILELDRLLTILQANINAEDQIYVQCDTNKFSTNMNNILVKHDVVYSCKNFNGNFSEYKNQIYQHCNGEWIFFIDADEYPSIVLLESIHSILDAAVDVDVIAIPRINTVEGIDNEHMSKWGWKETQLIIGGIEVDVINFPDYQWRIQRNKDSIRWINKIHEVLNGFSSFARLPMDPDYCLFHPKDIEKQERQNQLYSNL